MRPGDSAIVLIREQISSMYSVKILKHTREKFWRIKCKRLIEMVINALEQKKIENQIPITPYSIIDTLSLGGLETLYNSLEDVDSQGALELAQCLDTLKGEIDNFNWMTDVLIKATKDIFPEIVQRVEMMERIEPIDVKKNEANGYKKKRHKL